MATFHLTHKVLVELYELLCLTPPFSGWKLPKADDIVFEATTIDRGGKHGAQGSYLWYDKKHTIRVNPERHKTIYAAMMTLAHEMCHMRVQLLGVRYWQTHAGEFAKAADVVCRIHGFDRGQF